MITYPGPRWTFCVCGTRRRNTTSGATCMACWKAKWRAGKSARFEAWFWSKVDATGDCWEWTGRRGRGYGLIRTPDGNRTTGAYRYAYERLVGPIPAGLTLDHLCRNKVCVNPAHLEPVTFGENGLRGYNVAGINRRKTKCVNGHPFDVGNTYVTNDGKRRCRICDRERARRYRAAA